ncbi:galanin receptor type 1-like [Branchiostoma floridae]|uniref:Galanin receptor type 1-like n=1 Tax=Branchiostoma floridae TaxID=7739 RepID=C3XSP5_BRAFL|nr:galanin receptor type 1-like [Branchiostoma floridae]|eukprot:XP_002612957.1 hypothetical protein BRAFLDRAFT_74737 [Branchiostoma floridae]
MTNNTFSIFNETLPAPDNITTSLAPQAIAIPVVFSIIFLIGVTGNALVITIMSCNERNRRNTTSVFILNLAIADLMFIVFCVPFQGTIYTLPEWIFGGFMCKFVNYLIYVTMLSSTFTLTAMSFDRYLAVMYPITTAYLRTWKVATVSCLVIWAVSFATASPYAIYYNLYRKYWPSDGWFRLCYDQWPNSQGRPIFIASLFFIGYVLPFLIITFCYINILRELWCVPRVLQQTEKWSGMKKAIVAKKKAVKMVIVVVTVFGLCWLPHHVTTMWLSFGNFPYTLGTLVLKLTAHCLAYANSCMNPFIYVFLSDNFKKDIKRLLWRGHKRQSTRRSNRTLNSDIEAVHGYRRTMVRVAYSKQAINVQGQGGESPKHVRIIVEQNEDSPSQSINQMKQGLKIESNI